MVALEVINNDIFPQCKSVTKNLYAWIYDKYIITNFIWLDQNLIEIPMLINVLI